MGGKTKVERIGKRAERIVHQMRADGDSYREIAKTMKEKFGEEISHQAVKNYVEAHNNKTAEMLGKKGAKRLHEEKLDDLIDVKEELKKNHEKLEEIRDSLDTQNPQDIAMLLKVMKELRQEWKFQKDYIEQVVNPDKVEQNIEQNFEHNEVDVRVKLMNNLKKLEDEGYITIHEMPEEEL